MKPRVRFAPSPTGMLHIGGARTALFNWAYARHTGGAFLLRVEDTDPERSTTEYETAILEGLRWLGIDWDEGPDVGGDHGPYRQSERFPSYAATAERLLEMGAAYRCFCSTERIAMVREERKAAGLNFGYDRTCRDLEASDVERRVTAGESHILRFRVPDGQTAFSDSIRGEVSFDNADVDDWVMVRAGGAPTYNFVVVCDDAAMQISLVMRGEEHLTNTPKQVLLYRALGLEPPAFAHFPLMLGADRKKLSKRTGDTALQDYRDKGYPPEAVVNFLCLQGWALDDETDVFSAADLIQNFDPARVGKAGAVFDPEKFRWMSGEYIRMDTIEHLTDRCTPFVIAAGLASAAELDERRAWFETVVESERERIHTYADLPPAIAYLFASDDAVEFADKAVKGAGKHADGLRVLEEYLTWLAPRIEGGIDADALRTETKDWVGEGGFKMPVLFQPLRCALTGRPGGPDLFGIMALLGPAAVRARIESALTRLRG